MNQFLSKTETTLGRPKLGSRFYDVLLKKNQYRYILYIILLLPVFIFRDFTPVNELKYMSIIQEALDNNTWFTFYNHGEAYADKPPLFFWLAMLSRLITGDFYIGLIGLLSLLPTIGILAVMNKWMKEFNISYNPIVAELLLLTTAMFMGASLIIRMDMLMTFFIVMSLYTFFKIYANKGSRMDSILLPVYIFLAVFSKGPMGFLIPMVSIVAFLIVRGQLKTFTRFLGWKQWAIMLGLFALWFMAVYIEGGDEYLDNLLYKQTVGRGVNSFKHKEPFWFYFPRMFVTFAPWFLLYIVLIWKGVKKRMIKGDLRVFLATIVGVNILLLSSISAKIEIYMLPVYPFAVYLCASLLCRLEKTVAARIAVAIPAVVALLAYPFSFYITKKIPYEYTDLLTVRIGLFTLLIGGVVAVVYLRRKQVSGAIVALSLGMLSTFFLSSFALPQFNKYIGLSEMADAAIRTAKTEGISDFACYRFSVASNMDVYLGQEVKRITSISELEEYIGTGVKSILLVRETEIKRNEAFAEWIQQQSVVWKAGKYRWYIFNNNTATTFISDSTPKYHDVAD